MSRFADTLFSGYHFRLPSAVRYILFLLGLLIFFSFHLSQIFSHSYSIDLLNSALSILQLYSAAVLCSCTQQLYSAAARVACLYCMIDLFNSAVMFLRSHTHVWQRCGCLRASHVARAPRGLIRHRCSFFFAYVVSFIPLAVLILVRWH